MSPVTARAGNAARTGVVRRRSPSGVGGRSSYLQAKQQQENFPVALRVLPARQRADLQAVYDVARVIDDLGDEPGADRVGRLEALRVDLRRVWTDRQPDHPVLRRLVDVAERDDLTFAMFDRLVRANLQDQVVTEYANYADLVAYCTLSADPIGEMVLAIFGATTAHRVTLSNQICTALQILEHCQDVAEDRRAGRTYLPADDVTRFGVAPGDLDAGSSTSAVRELVHFQVRRAQELLRCGLPLVGELSGWARVAVAGFAAGGLATADALLRPDADVLVRTPRPDKSGLIRHALTLLVRRR